MVVTEKQAAACWCPMVRQASTNHVMAPAANVGPNGERSTCIASRCMMWRWQENENRKVPNPNKSIGGLIEEPRGSARLGYCGMAGAPRVTP